MIQGFSSGTFPQRPSLAADGGMGYSRGIEYLNSGPRAMGLEVLSNDDGFWL